MKRFFAQINGECFINVLADEMKCDGSYISVYRQGNLVAFVDVSVVLYANLSEKEVN